MERHSFARWASCSIVSLVQDVVLLGIGCFRFGIAIAAMGVGL